MGIVKLGSQVLLIEESVIFQGSLRTIQIGLKNLQDTAMVLDFQELV